MGIYSKVKRFGKTVVIFLILLMLVGCPESDNQNHRDTTIYLELIETGVTAVTLQISVEDTCGAWMFGLSRNDSIIMEHSVADKDTTINDTGLEPGTEYSYLAYWLDKGKIRDSSNVIIASTLDTTSHNIFWAVDTLGNFGSYLYDVWVSDENNIWVVGNIETDGGEYNAAHWDGIKWDLLGIYSNTLDLRSIWYFNKDNIWVTCGFPIHWDGNDWTLYHLQNMGLGQYVSVDYIWAFSANSIYFIGYQGSIVHYDGVDFEKMESGTDIRLTDIWGYKDDVTEEVTVWACGNESNSSSVLLVCKDGQWNKIYERYSDGTNSLDDETEMSPHGETLWIDSKGRQFQMGGGFGLFTFDDYLNPAAYDEIKVWKETGYFAYPNKIRGTGINDIFITGAYSSAFHFNGISWHWYNEITQFDAKFISVAATDNLVVLVGYYYPNFLTQGIVVRGER